MSRTVLGMIVLVIVLLTASRRDYIVWDSAALWNKALIHVLFLLQILKANRRGKNIVNRYMFEGFIQQSVQCRIARIYLLRLQMLSHQKNPTFPEELKLRTVHRVSDDLYID